MYRLAAALCLLTTAAHADGYAVGDTFEDPLQIAHEALASFPYAGDERPPEFSVDVSAHYSGQITILVSDTGLADDSVRGERTQYVLNPQDGAWTLNFMHRQYLCWRGVNTVTWQTDLCS